MTSKLQPMAFGIAVGIVWAAGILLAGLFAMSGWGVAMVQTMASFYLGYGPSILGAIVGAIWAAADGFIAGFLIAWVYNKVAA